MAKKSKKPDKTRSTKKSSKKSAGKRKSPKKKAAKKKSRKKSTKKKPAKEASKKPEPSRTGTSAAAPARDKEPDSEPPEPTEESPTPTEPTKRAPQKERPWAPEDDDTPADPWAEPEEPSPGDTTAAEPSPWEEPEPSEAEAPTEEERPWAEPEPAEPEQAEPDPWPSPDEDVVTADPAPPPEPEAPEEPEGPTPWEPVSDEPAPPPEPEPQPAPEPAKTKEEPAAGWRVAGAAADKPRAEAEGRRRGWPARPPERDELRARFDEASVRMGTPPLAALGWGVFFVGLLLITYAYYDVYAANAESVLLFAGAIRYDVLGAILLILGLITAIISHFVPPRRPHGPQPQDPPTAWVARADRAARWVTTHRTLSIIGWILAGFGLTLSTVALYFSWVNSNGGLVDYGITIGGRQFLYWRIGVALAVFGLVLVVLTYTRIRNARDARQGYLLAALAAVDRQQIAQQAAQQTKETSAEEPTNERSPNKVAGVTEQDLHALMKRLDGLMANLPEEQVAEFANSPEAETYLNLLEAAK